MPLSSSLRPVLSLIVVALVGASCTSGSDVDIADGGGAETSSDEGQQTVGAGIEGTVDDDLRYRCGTVEFGLSELQGAPAATAEGLDDGLIAALGSVEDYRRLESSNGPVFIDPEPLATEPPTLLVAAQGASPEPCVAIRIGVIELRPVGYELVDGMVVTEGCVSVDDLVRDARTVGDQEILSLYGPPLTGDEADCSIDPTRPLDLEVGPDVRSGLVYPNVVPSAALHEQLGFGQMVGALDPSVNGAVACQVESQSGDAYVQWSPLEPGFTATVVRDDQPIHTSEAAGILDAPSITAAAAQRLAGRGAPSIEPPVWGGGFTDLGVPSDGTVSYRVEISGGFGERLVVPCGQGGGAGGDVAVGDGSGTISQAQTRFFESAVLPYVYMTVAPICAGCSGEVTLQLSPEGQARVFVPPLAEQTDPSQAGLVDPFVIHRLLLDAEAAGKDVTYSFDPVTGVPVEWTIDGEGARILCLEVDTAPPDLRVTDGCSTDRDLIGR